MAKNRFDIGEVVATQMQQIMESDEHKRIFFNKKASDKCCSCASCGKDCPCKECNKECKACKKDDSNHVHDSNCAHDQKTSAVNEMVELLSKISTVQDELGLVQSSLVTMQALATMVSELRKGAQEDSNDMRWDEVIEPIKGDTDRRREFWQTAEEFPDVMDLLKRRVEESHAGAEYKPVDIFDEGVSADPASPLPSSGPDVVVSPDDEGDLSTWTPEAANAPTELPPESVALDKPLPYEGSVVKFNEFIEPDVADEKRDLATIPVPKGAFEKLNELLTKQAQEDIDFEDDDDDDDAELAALFGLTGDEGLADSAMASDLDEELESGDFLAKPDEDGGPGFSYEGPSETYPNTRYEAGQRYRDPSDVVRVGPGEWKRFDELSPEERLEQEMGAGLHDQLEMDPDLLTDEEVYPELWEEGPEDEAINKIREGLPSPEDDDYDPRQSRFWNDE